jgi:hypothetical protein
MIWFCKNQVPFKWKYLMTLHETWISLNLNSIQLKFSWKKNVNWWKMYWNYTHEYGVGK